MEGIGDLLGETNDAPLKKNGSLFRIDVKVECSCLDENADERSIPTLIRKTDRKSAPVLRSNPKL